MCFAMAGIEPILHAWLSRSVPAGSQGRAFGWSGSARAAGWLIAPLASGYVAWQFNVRFIFIVSGILLVSLGPILWMAMRNRQNVQSSAD
jgi:MFS family permease